MNGRIYLRSSLGELVPMNESPYDSERLLQELLAKHPDLLAGEQIDSEEPRRWLLISREMGVPAEEDGAVRWSLDHLFLDQDVVPTLVEVKRASDGRIRRHVVGQMLDYAANAVAYWPISVIQEKFSSRCESEGEDPAESLSTFLGDDENVAEFWGNVKTNLEDGRIRMVFVADEIPTELRRIIEFLNTHLDPPEVIGIEIKQFVGEGVQTLVPRVFGQTEKARLKKATRAIPGKQWDEESFLTAIESHNGRAVRDVAKTFIDWISPQVDQLWFGTGAREGGIVPIITRGSSKYHVCRITTRGWLAIRFDWLMRKPPFNDESSRRELLRRINEIPDIHFSDDVLATKRARIPLSALGSAEAMSRLQEMFSWMISQILDAIQDRSSV